VIAQRRGVADEVPERTVELRQRERAQLDLLRQRTDPVDEDARVIEFLLDKLRQTKGNSEFFDSMNT